MDGWMDGRERTHLLVDALDPEERCVWTDFHHVVHVALPKGQDWHQGHALRQSEPHKALSVLQQHVHRPRIR